MKNEVRMIYRKNKNGAALAYAIVVLLVISIFTVSIMSIFSNNLNQVEYQKHYTQAYYLAYSGVEMAFSALIAEDASHVPNHLFNQLKNGTITLLTQNNIAYGDGLIDIRAEIVNDTTSSYNGWIKITSTGTLNANNFAVTRILYIDPLDQQNTVWKIN
jgi:hypothetical protein